MDIIIEQLNRFNQLAMQSYRVDLKILDEKASELFDEIERLQGRKPIEYKINDEYKIIKNMKMIAKIDELKEKAKQDLSEYIKKNLKEIEERQIQQDNYKADFLKKLREDFSGEDTARKRLYKELGIEE